MAAVSAAWPFITLALMGLVLGAACWTDLRQRRIPNALVLAALVLAGGTHAAARAAGWPALAGAAWWSPLAGVLVGAAVLLPLHLARGAAAGDVKLMAAVAAFLGPVGGVWAALWTLVAGGLVGLCVLAVTGQRSMPYAPAIAMGSLMAAWQHGGGLA